MDFAIGQNSNDILVTGINSVCSVHDVHFISRTFFKKPILLLESKNGKVRYYPTHKYVYHKKSKICHGVLTFVLLTNIIGICGTHRFRAVLSIYWLEK